MLTPEQLEIDRLKLKLEKAVRQIKDQALAKSELIFAAKRVIVWVAPHEVTKMPIYWVRDYRQSKDVAYTNAEVCAKRALA